MQNKRLSIIIPVGPGELSWALLLKDLSVLENQNIEIILSAVDPQPLGFNEKYKGIKWIVAPKGRALQMNTGAQLATGEYLWFVHADSRFFGENLISYLLNAIEKNPNSLFYFNLKFLKGGPKLMVINELGVWIRSHWFGVPFGDQGLALKKDLFSKLGRFREDVSCGEDHFFVWSARHLGIPLRSVRGAIFTSARKYMKQGWFKTTLLHFLITYRQAIPKALVLFSKRKSFRRKT